MDDPKNTTSTDEVEPQNPEETGVEDIQEPKGDEVAEPEGAVEPEGTKTPEPSPRTYSEDEWRKFQSATDKKIVERDKTIQTIQQQYQAALAQMEDIQNTSFLKSVEEAGGDVNAAQLIITQRKALADQNRKIAEREAQINQRESQINQQAEVLAQAAKAKVAHDLIAEHGLDKKVLEELLKAETKVEMENTALKLRLNLAQVKQQKPVKVDSGIGSTKGVDLSKLPWTERLGRAMETSLK